MGKSRWILIILSAMVLEPFFSSAGALSVEEAYKAIPHRRTVFDLNTAKMTERERQYLYQLFELVDAAVVQRVETLIWLQSGGRQGAVAQEYDTILEQLQSLEVPKGLLGVHRLILEAIREQREALTQWQKKGLPRNIPDNKLVHSSSSKLIQAYGELMQRFPHETQHNRAAFFDYLCALDFI